MRLKGKNSRFAEKRGGPETNFRGPWVLQRQTTKDRVLNRKTKAYETIKKPYVERDHCAEGDGGSNCHRRLKQ